MNTRVIVFLKSKPPVTFDHVTHISFPDDAIVLVRPEAPVAFQASDVITFEGRPSAWT